MHTPLATLAHSLDISNAEAIRAALGAGLRIDKHADPVEDAREGLTEDEAIAVAAEDASLIVVVGDVGGIVGAPTLGEYPSAE